MNKSAVYYNASAFKTFSGSTLLQWNYIYFRTGARFIYAMNYV